MGFTRAWHDTSAVRSARPKMQIGAKKSTRGNRRDNDEQRAQQVIYQTVHVGTIELLKCLTTIRHGRERLLLSSSPSPASASSFIYASLSSLHNRCVYCFVVVFVIDELLGRSHTPNHHESINSVMPFGTSCRSFKSRTLGPKTNESVGRTVTSPSLSKNEKQSEERKSKQNHAIDDIGTHTPGTRRHNNMDTGNGIDQEPLRRPYWSRQRGQRT
jgi:hypothetical protein